MCAASAGSPITFGKLVKQACAGSMLKSSTSTISIASIPTRRLKKQSVRWPSWCAKERFVIWVCRKQARKQFGVRMLCIPLLHCNRSILCGRAIPRKACLALCRELGIGLVPYSPLGRGFLTGQIKRFEDLAADDYRRQSPRFQGENFKRNLELVERVSEIAREKKCTAAQLALAWVLAQGEDIVPIPGTKHRKYLWENIGALDVFLTSEDLARLDEVAPHGAAAGMRYAEAAMQMVDR